MQNILALLKTGLDLLGKRRFVHAAEKLAAAVAAAQEVLPEDSLIVALLQLERMEALTGITTLPGISTEDGANANTTKYRELLPAVLTTVERRKAAGTLLPGTCRGVEENFYSAFLRFADAKQQCQHRLPDAKSVGYFIYLNSAAKVLGMLRMAIEQRYGHSEAVQREYASFVVGVADLVAQACRARVPLLELPFVQAFKRFVDQPPVPEYAAVCSLLREKWEWLLRTSCVNKEVSWTSDLFCSDHYGQTGWRPPLLTWQLAGCAAARCRDAANASCISRSTRSAQAAAK